MQAFGKCEEVWMLAGELSCQLSQAGGPLSGRMKVGAAACALVSGDRVSQRSRGPEAMRVGTLRVGMGH
jgi:hypothetical protein